MTRRVLVLGVDGFIGSHLVRRILAERDWEVYGLDVATRRVGPLLSHPRFHFTQGDMKREREWVTDQVERCDVVLPLAAIATPASYVADPATVFELDFEANLQIVRDCMRAHRKIVFPSTSEVYGMCPDGEFDEESSQFVLGPAHRSRWIYSCAKQMLERVIHAYGADRGLRFTIFRPFNWIGPGQDNLLDGNRGASRVLTQFIGNVMRGEDIQLVGGGSQRRCFTYIGDGIDALVRIIDSPAELVDARVFNIGNPAGELSIRELADMVLDELGRYPSMRQRVSRVRVTSVPGESYYGPGYEDVVSRVPSVERARDILGWHPRTDVRDALRKTIGSVMEDLVPRAA